MSRAVVLAAALSVVTVRTAAAQSPTAPPQPSQGPEWQLGGFIDAGYLDSLNSPSNHLFRSRGTTPRVDEINVQMAGAYLRKKASPHSRWGVEATFHAGEDARLFGFSATAPNMHGAATLRHLGPTNISYLAPVGNGLLMQAGIFASFIGYDSLYAKDNLTYTRPWTADFTPYLMLGVAASYPLSESLTLSPFVVNGYWHLAHANDVPSIGGQLAKAAERLTIKQTVLYGPHQSNTSVKYWRFLSNTIVEWKTPRATTALDVHWSSEAIHNSEEQRAWWIAAQLPAQFAIRGPWRVTVRPEVAWDSEGRWTGFEQSVVALTSGLECRIRLASASAIVRFEHRYDHSRGRQGGFYTDVPPSVIGLTPGQHLFVFATIVTLDGSFRR